MRSRRHRGFTLTELLVVLSIFLILGLVSAVTFSNMRDHQTLRVATQDLYGALVDAQARTLGSSGDEAHGVHIESNRIIRFRGAVYVSNDPDNDIIVLPPSVTAVPNLAGGATDVVFERLSGKTPNTGTISLVDDTPATTTVTVHASGLIEL